MTEIFAFSTEFSETSQGIMGQIGNSGFMELDPNTKFSRRRRRARRGAIRLGRRRRSRRR